MKIEKTALNPDNLLETIYYYNSAREAMNDLFQTMRQMSLIKTIMLPGYIGWSPREGSGIFDAVKEIDGINIVYYKMDENLQIDCSNFKKCFSQYSVSAVLIVNYFGFRDINYQELCKYAHNQNAIIVEDNAHGFFTYYNCTSCYSDATFFSYHKMFPVSSGGGLKLLSDKVKNLPIMKNKKCPRDFCEWNYNIYKISEIRLFNYRLLDGYIKKHPYYNENFLIPLYDLEYITKGNIPQTYPVKIVSGNRNEIYAEMNRQGYGVVSLYHTLVKDLRTDYHSKANELSNCILNLPIHQDVDSTLYEEMVDLLYEQCRLTESRNGVNNANGN